MTIYELNAEMTTLLDMLEESADDQALLDTLECVKADYEDKLDDYACVIAQIEADAAMLKTEETRLAERRKKLEANAKRMKEAIKESMILTQNTKIKGTKFTFSVRNNAESVVIDSDIDNIPFEYLTIKEPEPNKTAIKEYLKNTKEEDRPTWAHLERSTSLIIK